MTPQKMKDLIVTVVQSVLAEAMETKYLPPLRARLSAGIISWNNDGRRAGDVPNVTMTHIIA